MRKCRCVFAIFVRWNRDSEWLCSYGVARRLQHQRKKLLLTKSKGKKESSLYTTYQRWIVQSCQISFLEQKEKKKKKILGITIHFSFELDLLQLPLREVLLVASRRCSQPEHSTQYLGLIISFLLPKQFLLQHQSGTVSIPGMILVLTHSASNFATVTKSSYATAMLRRLFNMVKKNAYGKGLKEKHNNLKFYHTSISPGTKSFWK